MAQGGVLWVGTALRVKDLNKSAEFYESFFQMRQLTKIKHESSESVFLIRPRDSDALPPRDSPDSLQYLSNLKDNNVLELVHEADMGSDFRANNGNEEPNRGFGHIAFNVTDLVSFCDALIKAGVPFRKKPDEGRMKNLAFALDPDGYSIELVGRTETANTLIKETTNLSQTMLRVKDVAKSLDFYRKLGMVPARKISMSDFCNYFLISPRDGVEAPPADIESPEAREFEKQLFFPVLELTFNFGTDVMPEFRYHNGNTSPKGFVGLTFIVQDLTETQKSLAELGIDTTVPPAAEAICATTQDPDGYWIRLLQRSLEDFTHVPVTPAQV